MKSDTWKSSIGDKVYHFLYEKLPDRNVLMVRHMLTVNDVQTEFRISRLEDMFLPTGLFRFDEKIRIGEKEAQLVVLKRRPDLVIDEAPLRLYWQNKISGDRKSTAQYKKSTSWTDALLVFAFVVGLGAHVFTIRGAGLLSGAIAAVVFFLGFSHIRNPAQKAHRGPQIGAVLNALTGGMIIAPLSWGGGVLPGAGLHSWSLIVMCASVLMVAVPLLLVNLMRLTGLSRRIIAHVNLMIYFVSSIALVGVVVLAILVLIGL